MIRAMGVAAVVLLLLVVVSCAKPQKPVNEPGEKVYALKGKIVSRDAGEQSVRVNHEAIPGFMEAMTMDYPVRGTTVQQLPADGAPITATLHVHDDKYWLSDVKPTR